MLVARVPGKLLEDRVALDARDEEQRMLLRRELYVATTRARDGLWAGVV